MKDKYWAGSEESHSEYVAALPKAEAMASSFKVSNPDKEPEFPSMYQRVGEVGIVIIEGTTIPGEAGFMRFFGIVGYDDIKSAFMEAVGDQDAKSILLLSRSGGGAVSGLRETVEFIRKVGAVKPMSGFADFMASAAYWMGSVASHITVADTAMIGSIGVLRVMTEYSEAFKADGITKKVMRAGQYKALGNPYEPFSPEALVQAQNQLDYLYGMMVTDISTNLGKEYATVDTVMAQGREFIGKQAVDAGLANKVGTFEEALAYAGKNRKLLKSSGAKFSASATGNLADEANVADNLPNTSSGTDMHKKDLSESQLAALAAGVPLAVVTAPAKSEAEIAAEVVAAANVAAAAAAAAKATDDAATAAARSVMAVEAAKPVAATDDPLVAFLKTELSTAQAAVAEADGKALAAAAQVSALEATEADLMSVVGKVVANLSIATGKKIDTSKMTSAELSAAYATQSELFTNTFKVGGAAAVTADVAPPVKKVALFTSRDAAAAKSIPVPNRKS